MKKFIFVYFDTLTSDNCKIDKKNFVHKHVGLGYESTLLKRLE